jgi:hypothetical protein
MKILGCDLHARQQTIAMVDTETGEFTEKTLEHCCPAKISGGHSNPLKISMITHGRSRNDLN